MKIGIDLQALQTRGSRNRGIGRYTQSVIEALFSQPTGHSYKFYANKTLPAPELDSDRFPYHFVDYPHIGSSNLNELLMKTTLLSADIEAIFLPSPMETLDSTLPDYTNFPKKVFVVCYDLIPLIFSERYLNDPILHSLYIKRLANVRIADFIFAISESTRQDVINYLNISPDKVLNVSGGVSSFFTPIQDDERQNWLKIFADKFGISQKFILYTGGEDWRKNIEGLVEAFSKLPKSLQKSYQLVIACKVSEFFAKEITELASRLGIKSSLILTNYITNEELRALYSTCSLFMFPSFYEGFGLPLLEAIACGAPAIASNRSSLPEIVGSAEQLFDPYSSEDIAKSIHKVLSNENLRRQLSENAPHQAAKFSWQSVAQKMSDVFREHQPISQVTVSFNRVKTANAKTQLAFLSPFRPVKSGIADYSQDLLAPLSEHFDLDLYHDESYAPDTRVAEHLFPHRQFEERLKFQDYEAIIYQMGNSSYHSYMYSQLMSYPGITVLHDYYLGGLINYMEAHCPELGVTLSKELEHSYGRDRAREILNLLQGGKLDVDETLPEAGIYLNRRIFTRSLGVVLHNRWAYDRAINDFKRDNDCIAHIPQLVPQFVVSEKALTELRRELDIPPDGFVISTFGFVNSTKRPLQILRAFKKYLSNHPLAYLIFVGGTDYMGSINIEGEVRKLSLQGQVKVTGYVDMPDFYRYIEISDICLNLRFPFKGESSASLLRILSVGKPTIVTDIGSFSDFPNDVVCKIPQPSQGDEVEEILKALVLLTENPEYSNSLSRNAAAYIAREHSPERCARLYAEFIEQVRRSSEANRKLLADYVGREAARLEVGDPEILLAPFARVIHPTSGQLQPIKKPVDSNKTRQPQAIEKIVDFNTNTQPQLIEKTVDFNSSRQLQTIKKPVDFNEFLHECRSICLGKIPPAKRILSIGCAGTWYFQWFHKFYPYSIEEHTGIDLNPKPENLPDNITWVQHEGSDLSSIESQNFDLVFAGQFIEHISWESQATFLAEVNRVLRQDGIFVLDSPNYTITNRYGWKQPEHIHELTFQQACDILQLAGFEIQESYGLVPKDLLGVPPELVGKYLNSCSFNLEQKDIIRAINREPKNSFVWWITAKKNNDVIEKDKLHRQLKELFLKNQANKNDVIFHQIGTLVEKKKDHFIAVNPSNGQGFAIFGPYEFYPTGHYLVEFGIFLDGVKTENTLKNTSVCTVDIVTDSGGRVFAKKEIKLGDLLKGEKIKLDFFLDTPCALEFRVLYLGKLSLLVGVKPRISPL